MIVHCEGAGLEIRQDAIGNMFARWVGSDPAAPAVGTGSHIDAIPNAANTTASWESLAASKQSARCSGADPASNFD